MLPLLMLCLLVAACKRSSDGMDMLGQKVVPAGTGFYVVMDAFTASPSSVNFSVNNATLSAAFSDEVTWTVTIRGTQSGAVKTITNTSSLLNEQWDGGSSNVYFFRTGEKAIAELSFMGSDLILRDTVTVSSPKVYNGKTFNGIKMTLIDDFETGGSLNMTYVEKDLNDANVIMATDTLLKVQGLNAMHMSGKDVSNNGWCGYFSHNTLKEIKTQNKCPQVTDPEALYVNLFIYGTGHASTAVRIKLYEIDNVADFNNAGYTYQRASNDAWQVDVKVDWVGWKCISKKYSTFTLSQDPANGGSGNKIKQPNQITGAEINLLSLPDAGASPEAYVDYLIFSEGGVFIP